MAVWWSLPAARESRQALADSKSRYTTSLNAGLSEGQRHLQNTDEQSQIRAPLLLATWLVKGFLKVILMLFLFSFAQWQLAPNQAHSKCKLIQSNSHHISFWTLALMVFEELHMLSRRKFTTVVTPFSWEIPRFFINNLVLVLPINLFQHSKSPVGESRLLTSSFYSRAPHK